MAAARYLHGLQVSRSILRRAGKRLGNPHLLGMLLLEGRERLSPCLHEGGEHSKVQGLELVCGVGGQADEGDVVLLAQLDDSG